MNIKIPWLFQVFQIKIGNVYDQHKIYKNFNIT